MELCRARGRPSPGTRLGTRVLFGPVLTASTSPRAPGRPGQSHRPSPKATAHEHRITEPIRCAVWTRPLDEICRNTNTDFRFCRAQNTHSGAAMAATLRSRLDAISAGTRAPYATSAVTLCDQVACDPRRAVPNRPQIIQPLDVQIARAVTPVRDPRSRGSLQWQQRPSAPKRVRQTDNLTRSSSRSL